MDVVNNVVYKEADEEKRANSEPHNLPVPVGTMTNHVLYIFFKSKTSKYIINKYNRGTLSKEYFCESDHIILEVWWPGSAKHQPGLLPLLRDSDYRFKK